MNWFFNGFKELMNSPSGFFALLSLLVISIVTLKQPSVGGVAFAAFFPVTVSLLAWCEHKETMAQIAQSPPTLPVPLALALPDKATL